MISFINVTSLLAITFLTCGVYFLCHPVKPCRCNFSCIFLLVMAYTCLICSGMINLAETNLLPHFFRTMGPLSRMFFVLFFLFFLEAYRLNQKIIALQSQVDACKNDPRSLSNTVSASPARRSGEECRSADAEIDQSVATTSGLSAHEIVAEVSGSSTKAISEVSSPPEPPGVVKLAENLRKKAKPSMPFGHFDLKEVIAEALAAARLSFPARVQIFLDLPDELLPFKGDANQIELAIANICVNSGEAMPQGGKLTVKAEIMQMFAGEELAAASLKEGPNLVITIEDTGTGIPFELQPRIFEPLFSTKDPGSGSGMGLSTAMQIVKKYNGNLAFKSEPGIGSCFKVILPLARPS